MTSNWPWPNADQQVTMVRHYRAVFAKEDEHDDDQDPTDPKQTK